jgi:hypothetical protein
MEEPWWQSLHGNLEVQQAFTTTMQNTTRRAGPWWQSLQGNSELQQASTTTLQGCRDGAEIQEEQDAPPNEEYLQGAETGVASAFLLLSNALKMGGKETLPKRGRGKQDKGEQVDTGKVDSPDDSGIVSDARGEIGVYEAEEEEGVATGGESCRGCMW